METFTQPKITGYRQLNEAEAALMNQIKSYGVQLGHLIEMMRSDGPAALKARAMMARLR